MCTNNDVHTRMMNGKVVQEDKHTINVITPAPGESSVTSYSMSPSSSTYVASYTDSSMNSGDVKVRTDRHGTVVQTDKTTINKIKPAPSQYAMLSNGYVMSEPSGNDVRVTTDKNGNVIQTDKTTINKITPAPSSQSTTVTTTDSSTTVTTSNTNDFQD
jgi:hypothetical protein